jgi:tetratricopeptide (TPR) repeat protein
VLAALGRRAALVASGDATPLCEAAVSAARRVGDPVLIADALQAYARACERAEELERAGALAGEAVALYREGGDPYGAAWALADCAWYDLVHGRLEEAERRLDEALRLRRRHGDDRRLVEPLLNHAWLLLADDDLESAGHEFRECLGLAHQVGDQFSLGEAVAGLSTHAALDGRFAEAALLAGASSAVHEQIGAPPWETVAAIHNRALVAAKDALVSRYALHFAEGRRLSAEDAVARIQTSTPSSIATNVP